jgi:YHS domain-containing protein
MKFFSLSALLLLLPMASSCVVFPSGDPRPLAEDPVCLYNRDLSCVGVRVDGDTFRTVYGGQTYYFCNKNCRTAFEAEPEKYIAYAK